MTQQMPTTEQIREGWDMLANRFDEYVTPQNMELGEQALRRVKPSPGVRFLDVPAGSGALSLPAARRGADVVAVDISPGMVERLANRANTEGLTNLTAVVMDGHALQFDDDTVNISSSLHGVSLFPDLSAGLAEMVRVTKPGGSVLVLAFGAIQKAEFLGFFLRAIKAAVPGFTPPSMDPPPLPFQASDPEALGRWLADAGLTGVTVDTTESGTTFESAAHLWNTVTSSNPLAASMADSLSSNERSDVQAVLGGMLRERAGGQPGAVLHTAINIGTGTK